MNTVHAMKTLLLLFVLSVLLPSPDAAALAKRPAEQWAFFHFDGKAFVPGRPPEGVSLAVRDGMRPVIAAGSGKVEAVKLTQGTGAVAGICYVQSSGGKLRSGSGFLPAPRVTVEISDGERVAATTETDANGYFTATLPAGDYKVSARGMAEVKVAKGKTTLISLRVGKRMVD